MLVKKISDLFDSNKIPYAVIGGFAVNLYGAVRGTIDLDIVINLSEKDFLQAEKALLSIGFSSRIPVTAKEVFHFREEYIKNKNLVAWSFYNSIKPSEIVDIVITCDLKDIKVQKIKVAGKTVKIISIDDLIRMKENSPT